MIDVLLTGGTGFIGSHLIVELREHGLSVENISSAAGRISEEATWENLPSARALVHLAARTYVPDSWERSAPFYQTNVMGTVNALEYCRKHDAKMVHISSFLYEMSQEPLGIAIPETHPLSATNPYGHSKFLAEQLCVFYQNNLGVRVNIIRPFNVYGIGQDRKFLIPHLLDQINEKNVITVQSLRPKRDYIHVDDVVSGIAKCLERDVDGEVFNLGTGRSYSVAEIIGILSDLVGQKFEVRASGETREGEISDSIADISNAKRFLDWTPQVGIREGLKKMLQQI